MAAQEGYITTYRAQEIPIIDDSQRCEECEECEECIFRVDLVATEEEFVKNFDSLIKRREINSQLTGKASEIYSIVFQMFQSGKFLEKLSDCDSVILRGVNLDKLSRDIRDILEQKPLLNGHCHSFFQIFKSSLGLYASKILRATTPKETAEEKEEKVLATTRSS